MANVQRRMSNGTLANSPVFTASPFDAGTNAQPRPLAVSPGDAARMAGIGRTKLYELMATNEIASVKLGSRRLIRVSAIEAWLDSLSGEA